MFSIDQENVVMTYDGCKMFYNNNQKKKKKIPSAVSTFNVVKVKFKFMIAASPEVVPFAPFLNA